MPQATTETSTGAPLAPASSGYAEVNGIKLYHEIYGQGEPWRDHAVAFGSQLPPTGSVRDLHPQSIIHVQRTNAPPCGLRRAAIRTRPAKQREP